MRPPIHPNPPIDIADRTDHPPGDDFSCHRVDHSFDLLNVRTELLVARRMRPALPFIERDVRIVIGVGSHAGRIINRKARVVADGCSASTIHFPVFVSKRKPLTRKVNLTERWNSCQEDQRQKQKIHAAERFAVHREPIVFGYVALNLALLGREVQRHSR